MISREEEAADVLAGTRPGRAELYIAKVWYVLRVLFFLLVGLFIAYLMLKDFAGVGGTLSFSGVIFLIRAYLGVKDSFVRVEAIQRRLSSPNSDPDSPGPRTRASNVIFNIGDLFIFGSLGLMAYILFIARATDGVSGVPMAIGVGIGFLCYLIAVSLRFFDK